LRRGEVKPYRDGLTNGSAVFIDCANERKKEDMKMIKTRTGAQRYNARMSRLFEEAVRLKKHYESITVVIDVRGGVAEVVSKPENINVVIRDWDNIGA
jgi:hypothetical protein